MNNYDFSNSESRRLEGLRIRFKSEGRLHGHTDCSVTSDYGEARRNKKLRGISTEISDHTSDKKEGGRFNKFFEPSKGVY